MFSKESKLTKYTLIGCVLLLVAYFSTSARADETEDVGAITILCAALTDAAGDSDSADWWTSFTVAWLGEENTAEAIAVARAEIKYELVGTPDWTTALKACASMRELILSTEE